uniref:Uncharacterized protein n=1 Tax=Clandestinovirus TaxID=2831644 RepID=A0A8F8KRC3_9VIRU|nr:hypothetical protein KOM_12_486 [Clandestinovirus]
MAYTVNTINVTNLTSTTTNTNTINAVGASNITLTPASNASVLARRLRGSIGSSPIAVVPKYVLSNITNIGPIAGTGTISFTTVVIPGGYLTNSGDYIKVELWGWTASNANAKTVRTSLGSIDASTMTQTLTTNTNFWWFHTAYYRYASSTTVYSCGKGQHATSTSTWGPTTASSIGSAFTSDLSLNIFVSQTATNDISFGGGSVTIVKDVVT